MQYYARVLFKDIPGIAQRLRPRQYWKLTLQLWWFVVSRKLGVVKSEMKCMFTYNGVTFPFSLRAPMDIAVLREVFLEEEYAWVPEEPRTIVDLGAHIGDTSVYYACRFPQAQIIAVEPSQHNFVLLQKNTAAFSTIHPTCVAVSGSDGESHLSESGSPLGFALEATHDGSRVITRTLASLIREYGYDTVDLVKFDIEGAEFDALTPHTIACSRAYIGELHFDKNTTVTPEAFKDMFERAGFKYTHAPLAQPGRFLMRAFRLESVEPEVRE
jgi:FkbM family methyltransferase